VVQANEENVLRPMVLCFKDNRILNLAFENHEGGLEIKDVMKTLDNRHVMDPSMIDKLGM
ncbi:MAG: hypothetical protein IKS87_00260, partial [Lachnospiraceae bacterium]|nr:hypothetical protein [Lachnospiraceae bacterium]